MAHADDARQDFGLGGAFALILVLALDHLPDPAQAATLAGFMQGIGFMIAALAPLVTGWLREAAGSFAAVWCYLGVVVVLLLPLLVRFDPRAYAQAMAGSALALKTTASVAAESRLHVLADVTSRKAHRAREPRGMSFS